LAVGHSRKFTTFYLNDDEALVWMQEQKVDFTDTRTLARSVGDIEVMGDGPARRLKFMAERSKGAPLTLIREG
jgi:hypothetical protein